MNGEIVWKGGNHQVSYSSPSLATYGGVRQIVIVNEATITGHDPRTGDVLWEAKWDGSSNSAASASQTVQVDDEHLFVSKGYSMGGGACLKSNTKNLIAAMAPRPNGRSKNFGTIIVCS